MIWKIANHFAPEIMGWYFWHIFIFFLFFFTFWGVWQLVLVVRREKACGWQEMY